MDVNIWASGNENNHSSHCGSSMGALKIRSIKVWAGNIEAAILNGQAKGPLQHAISKNHLSIKDQAALEESDLVGDIHHSTPKHR